MSLIEIIKRGMKDPGLYWYISPSYRQSKQIAWALLKKLLRNDEMWVYNEQELKASHPVGLVIELKGADNEDSLRGAGIKGLVMDECAFIKANVWPEILRPMLADSQGWAIFISTPKGRNWFFDIYQRGLDETQEDWGCWHHPTSVNKFVPRSELKAAEQDMSERLFRQEFMAEFLDDETGVFRGVRRCAVGETKAPEKGVFYVIGADLAKTKDFTTLFVINSQTRNIDHFERFQDVRWPEQKERIQRLALKYNNALVVLDSTGVGDAIFDDLQDANVSVEAFKFTNTSKQQLIEKLVMSIERRLITFPNDPILVDELMQFEYSITNEGRIKYGAPDGKHDDCVIGLALANWGIRHDLYATRALQELPDDEEVLDRVGRGEPANDIAEYTFHA
jgi:hypothetical protein